MQNGGGCTNILLSPIPPCVGTNCCPVNIIVVDTRYVPTLTEHNVYWHKLLTVW